MKQRIGGCVITSYHAKYFAYELTARKAGNLVDRLTYSLVEACVDLNPHQIEAALFALRSPLSKGVILADEVGLGKTIEAGLLLCQYWAEHKRRLLVICPASLRRQWSIELEEKFNLPSIILESKNYQQIAKSGKSPLQFDGAIIMSYNFASRQRDALQEIAWDLCVIDEAHKLRNVYKPDNKIGRALRQALHGKRKILLTATPLQNSLMELFGLASLIDDRIFGSEEVFKEKYINSKSSLAELRERIKPFVYRTLRRDVLEYIKYTNREAMTMPFTPSQQEQDLYEQLSDFILRRDSYSIPVGQRKLIVLVIRKLLSSSAYAIIGTLNTIKQRLLKLQKGEMVEENIAAQLVSENELGAEYEEEAEDQSEAFEKQLVRPSILSKDIDPEKLALELKEIDYYIGLASAITTETKAVHLLAALDKGFTRMRELGAPEKVIIFTESKRSQHYLKEFLSQQELYKDKIVTFNGQNNDDLARDIYNRWKVSDKDSVTGSREVDIRTALLDNFRGPAKIMIATEAGAEGINLQFCSLVVNYDMPWNPQRVEQRIGRCHRYGQKFDVVVINFLNEKNWADARIYELLRYKFHLFDGVFGASDEVLGSIEDGLGFEKRIAEILDTCRTQEEIAAAFSNLQNEREEEISAKLHDTQKKLFENFDEDVHKRLKVHKQQAQDRKDEMLDFFWKLTKHVLQEHWADAFYGHVHFNDNLRMFGQIKAEVERGYLPDKQNASFAYRLVHFDHEPAIIPWLDDKARRRQEKMQPIAYKPSSQFGQQIIQKAKTLITDNKHLIFDYRNYENKITVLENLVGTSGWLKLSQLTTKSFEESNYLFITACDKNGTIIHSEIARKLFKLTAIVGGDMFICQHEISLQEIMAESYKTFLHNLDQSNSGFLNEEMEKLDHWADDKRAELKAVLKDIDEEIKQGKKEMKQSPNFVAEIAIKRKQHKLEQKRDEAWRQYDKDSREIDKKKEELFDMVEARLKQNVKTAELFTISYEVI